MDFEEWWENNGEFREPTVSERDAFEAGQQSKQAEIDALKAKLEEIENHAFMNYDYERDDDHHSYWSGYNVAMGEFVCIIKGDQK